MESAWKKVDVGGLRKASENGDLKRRYREYEVGVRAILKTDCKIPWNELRDRVMSTWSTGLYREDPDSNLGVKACHSD